MPSEICRPDYNHCLVNLTNSIRKHYGLKPYHSTLAELDKALEEHNYRTVILLVLDGLGIDVLEKNLPENSFFRENIKDEITSVYPPTTTVATTSIYSGLCPCEHGWAGWQAYFKEYDKSIELFRNVDFYTQEKVGGNVAKEHLIFERINESINKSGNAVGYGVAQPWGNFEINDFADLCKTLTKLSKKDEKKFVLSYWKYPDAVMHRTGCIAKIQK